MPFRGCKQKIPFFQKDTPKKAPTQLAQWRCHNVVTTLLLTFSRCDTVKNESCADVGFRRCDNVALRRYQDIATTLSIGFLGYFTTDYSGSFPFIKT